LAPCQRQTRVAVPALHRQSAPTRRPRHKYAVLASRSPATGLPGRCRLSLYCPLPGIRSPHGLPITSFLKETLETWGVSLVLVAPGLCPDSGCRCHAISQAGRELQGLHDDVRSRLLGIAAARERRLGIIFC